MGRKYFELLLIISLLTLLSCGDDNITNPDSFISNNTLKGKIEQWDPQDSRKIGMVDMFNFPTSGVYRYGESEIKSDGSFNIFLKNPPSEYLRSLKGFDAVPTNQLEFSSPDVKGYMAFLKLFDEAKPNVIDNIICGNTIRKENVGEYDIYFVYSEGDFDITGVQRDTNEFMKIKTYYEYDIHFKKGWNARMYKTIEVSEQDGYKIYGHLFSTNIDQDVKYFYK